MTAAPKCPAIPPAPSEHCSTTRKRQLTVLRYIGSLHEHGEFPDDGDLPSEPLLQPGDLFPGEVCQLRAVRRWLESLLPVCPPRDDVMCVATELGTNAICVCTRRVRG